MNAPVSNRYKILTLCTAVVAALLVVAGTVPLPVTVAGPGETANVLGTFDHQRVITVSGVPVRRADGQLRMVTISATGPTTDVHFTDVASAWLRTDRAAMPRDAVYPAGNAKDAVRQNTAEMRQSQDAATVAALRHLRLSPAKVSVELRLAGVGGPSAGLLFTLGIIDLVDGDGHGGDLTGGRTIAGTGTITGAGAVGEVGGVQLKEQAARRDGATVFLVPRAECADAKAVTPAGLRVVPVTTLDGALSALSALRAGHALPSC